MRHMVGENSLTFQCNQNKPNLMKPTYFLDRNQILEHTFNSILITVWLIAKPENRKPSKVNYWTTAGGIADSIL